MVELQRAGLCFEVTGKGRRSTGRSDCATETWAGIFPGGAGRQGGALPTGGPSCGLRGRVLDPPLLGLGGTDFVE